MLLPLETAFIQIQAQYPVFQCNSNFETLNLWPTAKHSTQTFACTVALAPTAWPAALHSLNRHISSGPLSRVAHGKLCSVTVLCGDSTHWCCRSAPRRWAELRTKHSAQWQCYAVIVDMDAADQLWSAEQSYARGTLLGGSVMRW
jgi:hypothetical protein